MLKGYQHLNKTHVEDNKCTCGDIETLLTNVSQCDEYDMEREKLRHFVYFKIGSLNLDMDTLIRVLPGLKFNHRVKFSKQFFPWLSTACFVFQYK